MRALVLANTATRIGAAEVWARRIATVRTGGLSAIADATMEQTVGRRWQDAPALPKARAMLMQTDPEGWIGVASAIAGSDFYQTTATLRLPTLVIAATNDATTPPDMQRELADLVTDADFHLLRNASHLSPLDQPQAFAARVDAFLKRIGFN